MTIKKTDSTFEASMAGVSTETDCSEEQCWVTRAGDSEGGMGVRRLSPNPSQMLQIALVSNQRGDDIRRGQSSLGVGPRFVQPPGYVDVRCTLGDIAHGHRSNRLTIVTARLRSAFGEPR
jgi:hypothetical protein